MKILVVSQYFYPEQFIINDLCRSLSEKGHQVTVLTGVPNYPQGQPFDGYNPYWPKNELYHGAQIKRVPLFPRGKGNHWRLALNYLSFAFTAGIFGPFKCREKYDLIFVMQLSPATVGLPAILFKFLKKSPILFWVQDLWPESLSATRALNKPFLLGLVRKMMKFIYKNCDAILVQSEAFKQKIQDLNHHNTPIHYLPNWAPLGSDRQVPATTTSNPDFRVMFAGNFGAAQNLEIILDAAESLKMEKKIKWVLVGDGRQMPWLKHEIEKRQLQSVIDLPGRQPVEEMPNFFSSADCLLVTLRKDPIFELTVPSKVQAYLAAGKPIIAALDGEAPRVIEEAKAGFCGPSENVEKLIQNVLAMMQKTPAERQILGENGRSYFEKHFSNNKVLNDLEHIIDIFTRS